VYKVLLEPTLDDAKKFLEDNLFHSVITIFGECEITYKGRAFSTASYSPRILLIKVDGSVIIHEATKREPTNWQPPGTRILVNLDGRVLRVYAERKRPKEILEILFSRVYYITSAQVYSGNFTLVGSEKDEVDLVINNPELIEEGLKPLEREYRTPYGTVDLLGIDRNGVKVVMEFKRAKATLQAVSQLYRYVLYFREQGETVRGILVSPGISQNAFNLLKRLGLEYVNISDKFSNTSGFSINIPNLQRDKVKKRA
jgi:RecB family endonuclease NucS